MNKTFLLVAGLALVACQPATEETAGEPATPETAETPAESDSSEKLAALLDAQPDEVKARYAHRHPQETLEFFGIEPGMTVLEGLPGRGWYSKVLLQYLGSDGCLIGADYSLEMYPNFFFATEEFMARQSQFVERFPADAAEWGGENGAAARAFHFGSMPDEIVGTADIAFFPRVLHNLARFESEGKGDYLTAALADTYRALKPGGIFGVVQHLARDDMPDEWAYGANGYLKRQFIIDRVEAAGFEFVSESDINANPDDQPTVDDFVWRLPPTYATSEGDEEVRAKMDAIGESNRITLKFRKPR
ncbi:MAG: class I SAM-dependent methyltransferase [Woeseiaceae bacterium]